MQYGLYVSAAGALANSYQQDVVANNLANAETVSFKRDMALVQARRTEAAESGPRQWTNELLETLGGGVFALPTTTDFSTGPLEQTDRPYDVALQGEGFFQVQMGEKAAFTRDGRFRVDEQGRLVTMATGLGVLGADGRVIEVDQSRGFQVNDEGVISQEGAVIGQLAVVDVADKSQLHKRGQNLYVASGTAGVEAVETPVKQGMLEGSGVKAIEELTRMIKAQRAFQNNVSALQMQDQTLGLAVTRLGRISA